MITFKIQEDCNVLRMFDEEENSAVVTEVTTRKISPAIITENEFDDFLREHTTQSAGMNEIEGREWIFQHPDLGDVHSPIDEDESDAFDTFRWDVAYYLQEIGILIKDVTDDECGCMGDD